MSTERTAEMDEAVSDLFELTEDEREVVVNSFGFRKFIIGIRWAM
jgi:hypothetical protein